MPVSFDQVESALEHLWDFAYLGRHPLVVIFGRDVLPDSPSTSTFLARGRAVNRVLQAAIGELRTPDASARLTRERHYHDILYYCYVRGEKNDAVAARLQIAERTLYRHRKRAIEALELILEAMRTEAGSSTPAKPPNG